MKIVLYIAVISFLISCISSNYTLQDDEKTGKIIVGKITWQEWQRHAGWSDYSAADYSPSNISEFRAAIDDDISFLLFAGSWCGDSKSEVPKIFKLFKQADIENKIRLYGLDRQKEETSGVAKLYKIERVPTLVILKNNNEAGRIIEYPEESWGFDIMKIILGKI